MLMFFYEQGAFAAENRPFNIVVTSDEIKHGVELYKQGKWEEAEAVFRAALEKEPEREDLKVLIGSSIGSRAFGAYGKKEYKVARELFLEALKWDSNPEFILSLTVIYVKEEKFEEAGRYFDKLSRDNPKRGKLYRDISRSLGKAFLKDGDKERGRRYLEIALEYDPDDEEVKKLLVEN